MADIDLATILADGEYLKRSGDDLVGDIPETGGAADDVYVTVPGGADFNNRFKAAIDQLVTAGGGVIRLNGTGTLTEPVTIPHGIGLVGRGKNSTDIIDIDEAGQLRIGSDTVSSRHPTIGGFTTRTTLAPVPVYFGFVVNSYIHNIRMIGGAQIGALFEYAQNCMFDSLDVVDNVNGSIFQYAVTIGTGVNNLTFENLYATGGTIAVTRVTKTTANQQSGTILPHRVRFMGGLNENPAAASRACVLVESAQDVSWYNAQTSGPVGVPAFLVTTETGVSTVLGVRVVDCQFRVDPAGTTTSLFQVTGRSAAPISEVSVQGCRWLNGKGYGLNQYGSLRDRGGHSYENNDKSFTSLDAIATDAQILTDATPAATWADVVQGTSTRTAVTPKDFITYVSMIGAKAVATGGTVVDDAGYRYHLFTTAGASTLTVTTAGFGEAFLVGGGGAGCGGNGGNSLGGGGGGGGVVGPLKVALTAGAMPVVVGVGGVGAVAPTYNSGANSTFAGVTATGGGGGAMSAAGLVGGSGGGGGTASTAGAGGGNGVSGQGSKGGAGFGSATTTARSGGGGGGYSQLGAAGAANVGGKGGDGIAKPWAALPAAVYAAGGGGSANAGMTVGAGGSSGVGGAGAAAGVSVGVSAQAGTGSGGGGARNNNVGGSGSTGIVAIRYQL